MSYVKSPLGERDIVPGQGAGIPWVTGSYRFAVAITPAVTALPNGACDGIMVSQDATVEWVGADDASATPVATPLKVGTLYPFGAIEVHTVSAGTAYALYHRKPGAVT